MAYTKRRNSARSKSKRSGTRTKGTVRVKGHSRSPRGNNAGKKRVRVSGYTRGKPRD